MPNNVYIGSRYVPIFAGAWSATETYESLTIVDYGNNSFTSKRPVPLNTPPTTGDDNDPYWALTGNYNGQIANLQNQINTNASNIAALTNKIDGKYVIVTDSYGGTFGGTLTPYTTIFANAMGLTPNVDFFTAQTNGAGFVSNGRLYDTALNAVAVSVAAVTNVDTITDVLILGGCNDAGITSVSDMETGMARTIGLAKTLFPKAKIYVGVIGGLNSTAGRQEFFNNAIPNYLGCAKFGALPLQNLQYVMTRKSYFQGDNVHPNQYGMNAIGYALASAFSKGYSDNSTTPMSLTENSSLFSAANWSAIVYATNERVDLNIKTAQFTLSGSTLASGNVVLGDFTNDILIGNIEEWFFADVAFFGQDAEHKTLPLALYNGTLYLINDKARTVTGFSLQKIHTSFNRLLT